MNDNQAPTAILATPPLRERHFVDTQSRHQKEKNPLKWSFENRSTTLTCKVCEGGTLPETRCHCVRTEKRRSSEHYSAVYSLTAARFNMKLSAIDVTEPSLSG